MIYRPVRALQALARFQHLDPGDLILTGPRRSWVRASTRRPAATQPLPVQQMSPRELGAQRGTRKPIDRLPVAGLGVASVPTRARQRASSPSAQSVPLGAGVRVSRRGVLSPVGLVAADARLDELRQ